MLDAGFDRVARRAVVVAVHFSVLEKSPRSTMDWNSSFEVNQYLRPLLLPTRRTGGVRHRHLQAESSSSKALTKLDLPVPLGAETTNKLPG